MLTGISRVEATIHVRLRETIREQWSEVQCENLEVQSRRCGL
jgi:hypothetical protein